MLARAIAGEAGVPFFFRRVVWHQLCLQQTLYSRHCVHEYMLRHKAMHQTRLCWHARRRAARPCGVLSVARFFRKPCLQWPFG
jgi:hypothetical protein